MRISRFSFLFVFAIFLFPGIATSAPPAMTTVGELRTQISWRRLQINEENICYNSTPEVFVISGEEAQTLVPPGSISDGAIAEYLEELWSATGSIALKIQVEGSSETIVIALHNDLVVQRPTIFENTGLGAFFTVPDSSEETDDICCNYKGKVEDDTSCGCSVVCEFSSQCPDAQCKVCLVGEPAIDIVSDMCGEQGPFIDPKLIQKLEVGDTL